MKKVIRLTEQDLSSIIQKVIKTITGDSDVERPKTKISKPNDFDTAVNKVIDNFEKGYYHPDMAKSGQIKGMGDSGETMMGMDRKHGATFANSNEGKEFWSLIDKANARQKWTYNYMGGPLEGRLRKLVSEMIKPEYNRLSDRYLSPEAQKIVKNSPELTFHFIYATWNGSGWFQKFAKVINNAVEKGETNPDNLIKLAIQSRKLSGNSLIAKSGNIMSKVLNVA